MEPGKFYEPLEGYLYKKGNQGIITWAKRWFSLRSNILTYSRDPQGKEVKGRIFLKDALSISPCTSSASSNSSDGTSRNSEGGYFQIVIPGRTYYLLAENQESMKKWLDFLIYSKSFYNNDRAAKENSTSSSFPSAPEMTETVSTKIEPSSAPSLSFNSPSHTYGEFSLYSQPISMNNQTAPQLNPIVDQLNTSSFPASNPYFQPSSNPNAEKPHIYMTPNLLKEIHFTEGDGLSNYIETFNYCCTIINGNRPQVLPGENNDKKRIICVYLGLRTLEFDNRDSFLAYSSSGYDNEKICLPFSNVVSFVQRLILETWTMDAPTILTKIDTWIKRKRSIQQLMSMRGDKESILKWNIVMLNHLQQNFLLSVANNREIPQLLEMISSLVDLMWEQIEELPAHVFASKLWNSLDYTRIPANERTFYRNFLETSLIFQKLKLENDQYSFTKYDPYLANMFETILTESSRDLKYLNSFHSDLRNAEVGIFRMWHNYPGLLHWNSQWKCEQFTFYLKNLRIIKRIAVKLDKTKFGKLQDSMFLCAIGLDERMPKLDEGQKRSNVPFPDSGSDLLLDLMNTLKL